jgi:hypothetical protein
MWHRSFAVASAVCGCVTIVTVNMNRGAEMAKLKPLPVMTTNCPTCPWVPGSEFADLVPHLTECALTSASRICHCTGTNAVKGKTGKPERLCRGARDVQLQAFYNMGYISAPTDEAWAAKVAEINKEKS